MKTIIAGIEPSDIRTLKPNLRMSSVSRKVPEISKDRLRSSSRLSFSNNSALILRPLACFAGRMPRVDMVPWGLLQRTQPVGISLSPGGISTVNTNNSLGRVREPAQPWSDRSRPESSSLAHPQTMSSPSMSLLEGPRNVQAE